VTWHVKFLWWYDGNTSASSTNTVNTCGNHNNRMCFNTCFVPDNYMEQVPTWEANSCLAGEVIPSPLWYPGVHNSPPLVHFLSHMNPVHTSPPYFRKIHSNIIVPATPTFWTSANWSVTQLNGFFYFLDAVDVNGFFCHVYEALTDLWFFFFKCQVVCSLVERLLGCIYLRGDK